jgi:hypothetical protein
MDSIYQNCRWCKHFSGGVCKNERAFDFNDDIDLSPFWENGYLAEAIDEGYGDSDFFRLEDGLRAFGISDKRIKTLLDLARQDAEEWKDTIASSVERALDNYDFDAGGVTIADLNQFYCSEYM